MDLLARLGWHTGRVTKWGEIADDIRRQIDAGTLAPGALTKSRRELAEEYGVADGTSKRALEHLVAEGVLESVPQVGYRVTGEAPGALPARMTSAEARIAAIERHLGLPPA